MKTQFNPHNRSYLNARSWLRRWLRPGLVLIGAASAGLGLSLQAKATCQEGCGSVVGNTFLGDEALIRNTTGHDNTANGSLALPLNATGYDNTATGYNTLYVNSSGSRNVATGAFGLRN